MTPNLFVVGDDSSSRGEYMSSLDMILCVTQPGEALTLEEIDARVNARFGHTSVYSLKNALNRACKRGEFQKQRGRANLYHRSSSP